MDNYIQARCRHDTGAHCPGCLKKVRETSTQPAHKCTRFKLVAFQEAFAETTQSANLALRRLNEKVLAFVRDNERRGDSFLTDYRPEFDYSTWKPSAHLPMDVIGERNSKPKTRKKRH